MPKALKLLFVIVIPTMLYGSITTLLSSDGKLWVCILLLLIAIFCLIFAPATILCCSDKLISISLYGLRKVSLNWADVISAYFDPKDNSITIRDKFDHTVVHTAYNVGRADFIEQLRNLPYNFAKLI